jgi:hypothetical protein
MPRIGKGEKRMWSEVAEVAIDVLAPNAGPDLDPDSIFHKENPNLLRVPLIERESFKRRLNQSGWFEEEVLAGGLLTQGKAQSLLSMATGWALVEMARGRRCKSLPREFCVAVMPSRVVTLGMSPWSEGGGGEGSTDAVVKVKREEIGSWSRGSLRIDLDNRKLRSGLKGGTLDLGGLEQFPVNWSADTQTDEMVALLARG